MSNIFFSGYLALGSGYMAVPAGVVPIGSGPLYVGSTLFVEVNAPFYARQPIAFSPLISGNAQSLGVPQFPAFTPLAPTTQYGLFDATGNLLLWWQNGALSPAGAPIATATSFTLSFPSLVSFHPCDLKLFAGGGSPANVTAIVGAPAGNAGMAVSFPTNSGVRLAVSGGQLAAF